MKKSLLIPVCIICTILPLAFAVFGQTASQGARAARPAASPAAQPAPVPAYQAQLTVLEDYCLECHNKTARTANLALDELNIARVGDNVKQWERVVRKLRAGMMPPAGQERPDPAVYKGLIVWLENELDRHGATVTHLPPPGAHRLNRTEYENAVRDLLDLDIDVAKYLPSDDSSYGFDNMAGTLTLSTTLVEAYVTAGQKISRLAMGEATTPNLTVYRAPEDTSQDYHVEGFPFGTRGGMLRDHIFPSDGEYIISVLPVFGDNMSPTGFGTIANEKVEVTLDGERLALINYSAQRNQGGGGFGGQGGQGGGQGAGQTGGAQNAQSSAQAAAPGGLGPLPGGMRVRFKTTAGPHAIGATFIATNFAPLADYNKHFDRTTVQTGPTPGYTFFPHVGSIRIEGPFNAATAQDSPSRRKIFVCRPASAPAERACAQRIITNLATQAYRRPATATDVSELMEFYEEGRKEGTFDDGIEWALARILAAPKFVYRLEAEPPALKDGQSYRISDLELASRLSFFLWSRGPDTELRTLATQGRLKDPAVLDQQVRRMLKDPRSEALAINFAGQWLNLRGLDSTSPLPLLYPDFDDPLRQSMRREVELLFDSIVREDRNVVDLLNADYTFVDERLARHYGIKNVYGSQFRRVTLGDAFDVRRGLLGKGSILVTTAKPDRNSPVTRGKWIMTNILGFSPPDPPPGVPNLPTAANDARGNAKEPSMRQKMLDHRTAGPACAQCHTLMDPIGFALENFDAISSWRTEDVGERIVGIETMYDGTRVEGPVGLRKWILANYSEQFMRVVSEKLLTYGLGRGVEAQDMPLVRSIVRDAAKNNNRFSSLVLGVVRSKPFQMNMKVQQSRTQTTESKKEGN